MFPLNLPGPQFLAFYFVFALAVIAVVYVTRQRLEAGPTPTIDPADPYLFACLRGGPPAGACIATLGLIDRGVLRISGQTVSRAPFVRPETVRRRVESEVLRHFDHDADLFSVMKSAAVLAAATADYEDPLRRNCLVPDERMQSARENLLLAA